jgi:HEAT repeat protein
MTSNQIISSAVSMLVSFALALLLGRNPPLSLYAVLMGIGILAGSGGSLLLYRIPEPPASVEQSEGGFFAISRKAFSKAPFRRFILIFFAISIVSSVSRAFLVVYSREIYSQGDGMVALLAVFGGLGALAMGLSTRLLVDRVGAKPLYITYTGIAALSLVPVLIAPFLGNGPEMAALIFLGGLFFLVSFGFAGAEGVAQNYFFGLIKSESVLDLGILYYIVYGIAGASGSFLAGLFLDGMFELGYPPIVAYRYMYGFLLLIIAAAIFLQRKLIRMGALSLKGALGVIFSFRDLRAITLLDRLDKSKTVREQEVLLEALHSSPSTLAISELLNRARSPRLAVRVEALRAIEAQETLNPEAEQALMADMELNPYTTAYIAARILGRHKVRRAIQLLRKNIRSDDYMLAGESMLALARLKDLDSRESMEGLIAGTRNPRLRIMGVSALETYGSIQSISVLLDLLREEDPPPYLRDEVTLAMAGILGVQARFYPLLVRYLEDPSLAKTLVLDEADAAAEGWRSSRSHQEHDRSYAERLRTAIDEYMAKGDGRSLSLWILELPAAGKGESPYLFAEAALDDDLMVHDRFRLLLCCWAAGQLGGVAQGADRAPPTPPMS